MKIKKDDKTNTYYFSVSLGFDAVTGKRRQTTRRGFKTKKEAEMNYQLLKQKYFTNNLDNQTIEISFSNLATLFLEDRATKVRKTTFQGERTKIYTYILPHFKNAIIDKITRLDIVAYQKYLASTHLSHNSVNKVLLSMKQLFDFAIENNYATINPCLSVRSLKVDKKKMDFWTLDEFKQFIKYVTETQPKEFVVFYTLAYMTGARLSELLACRWEDISTVNRNWRICKTLHYNTTIGFYLDVPKTTSSNRTITLNSSTFEMIMELKQLSKSDFVFATQSEFPNKNKLLKSFYQCIEKSGVKKIRFHDLRHSHVALLIDMKEQDYIVTERIGHASIRITYDIYGHLFPTRQNELANKLELLL